MKKEESRKKDSELKGLLLAVKLIWGSHKYLTLALATATLLQSTMPAAMAWLGKLIVDSVIHAINAPNRDRHQLSLSVKTCKSAKPVLSLSKYPCTEPHSIQRAIKILKPEPVDCSTGSFVTVLQQHRP
jgi:hypothetical protein